MTEVHRPGIGAVARRELKIIASNPLYIIFTLIIPLLSAGILWAPSIKKFLVIYR